MSVARAWSTSVNWDLRWILLRLEFGYACLQAVTFLGKFARAPVIDADLVGTGQQMLTRLAKELLARCRARLQGIEPHALGGQFVFVPLVAFLDRVGKPGPLGAQFGEIPLDMTQATVGRRQAGFGLGQLAGHASALRR